MTRFFISKAVLITTIIFVLTACGSKTEYHRWTEKEKADFKIKCEQTDTFNNIVVFFRGFDNNAFDSVLIKEYMGTVLLDSFRIFVSPFKNPWDKEHKRRSGTIFREMNIKYKYLFTIPGNHSYELSNMEMVVWPMYTETSEGYGCEMANFTIDEKKFKGVGNPEFEK